MSSIDIPALPLFERRVECQYQSVWDECESYHRPKFKYTLLSCDRIDRPLSLPCLGRSRQTCTLESLQSILPHFQDLWVIYASNLRAVHLRSCGKLYHLARDERFSFCRPCSFVGSTHRVKFYLKGFILETDIQFNLLSIGWRPQLLTNVPLTPEFPSLLGAKQVQTASQKRKCSRCKGRKVNFALCTEQEEPSRTDNQWQYP